MTKRQRAQVVELLRCAADSAPGIGLNGMFAAKNYVSIGGVVFALAWKALLAVSPDWRRGGLSPVDEGYRRGLLEAAARVEEGSWP